MHGWSLRGATEVPRMLDRRLPSCTKLSPEIVVLYSAE